MYMVRFHILQGGYTALHMAAFVDDTQVVEILLTHSSDPNLQATVSRHCKNCSNMPEKSVLSTAIHYTLIMIDRLVGVFVDCNTPLI